MYESEKLLGNDRAPSIIRLSSYLSIKLSNPKLAFTSISYVQPRADDFADLRLTTENEFSSDIGSGFKFTLSFSAAYDARPPGVVEEWDFATRAGLKYAWSES
jgi:hypothetical protein